MEICVEFVNGRLAISPDPAVVTVDTPIVWFIRGSRLALGRLQWTIYFHHGTPFPDGLASVTAATVGDHSGATTLGPAVKPGDYKYGVSVGDAETGELLGDDDPRLIVRPR